MEITNKEIQESQDKKICFICKKKFIKKKDGLVCKNWKCPLYWKLGKGWVYHEKI